jgi:hypothetical protein
MNDPPDWKVDTATAEEKSSVEGRETVLLMLDILQQIESEGYLEDRMEYGVDELMIAYQIGRTEAEFLDAMVTVRAWGLEVRVPT